MTKTALFAPQDPNKLPIWARLNLISQGIPFEDVRDWERETTTRILAFLRDDYSHYTYLYKR